MARKLINSVPQTAATTFAFYSVLIPLLWIKQFTGVVRPSESSTAAPEPSEPAHQTQPQDIPEEHSRSAQDRQV